MFHYFNTSVACSIGAIPAILLQYLHDQNENNRLDNRNFHDGYFWTKKSVEMLGNVFPYLSTKQIRYALSELRKTGYIATGNYNKTPYDRTLWYAVTERGMMSLAGGSKNSTTRSGVTTFAWTDKEVI